MSQHLSSLTELFRFFLLMILNNSHTNSLSVNRLGNYYKIGKIQIIWFRLLVYALYKNTYKGGPIKSDSETI